MWNDFTKDYTNVLHESSKVLNCKITLEFCLLVHYRFQNISITSACLQNNNKRSTIQAPKIRRRRHRQRERETTAFVFLGFLCSFLSRGTVPPPSAGILPPPTPVSPRAPASSARKKTVRGIAILWPGRELSLQSYQDFLLSSRDPPTSFVRRVFPGGGGGVPSEKAMRAETKMEAPSFFFRPYGSCCRGGRLHYSPTHPTRSSCRAASGSWTLPPRRSSCCWDVGFASCATKRLPKKLTGEKSQLFSFPIGALWRLFSSSRDWRIGGCFCAWFRCEEEGVDKVSGNERDGKWRSCSCLALFGRL